MRNHDKRLRILDAATAVFAERDFHQVLVSEVATRAGVGKGTVYLYFPTKDDLQRAALEASLERLAGDVERAAAREGPADAVLGDVVLIILRLFWRRPHLLTLVQRFEQRYERWGKARRRRVREAIEGVLARHRLGGGMPRSLAVAFLLGLARAAILEHADDERPETYATRVVALFVHGLGGRGEGSALVRRRVAG
jgi:AcrR family transcriptional regulator